MEHISEKGTIVAMDIVAKNGMVLESVNISDEGVVEMNFSPKKGDQPERKSDEKMQKL